MLLWSCGIHGASIIGGVMSPIWYGRWTPTVWLFRREKRCRAFYDTVFQIWINVGGSGATLALVLTMLVRSRSKQMKQLASRHRTIFNINEPIIFGMPLVMNPLLIVPFIIAPLLTITATYIGMSTGMVAKPAGIAVPWTMPPLISGYLATGGKISGSVMQLINLLITFIIYYPFFRIWDLQNGERNGRRNKTSLKKHKNGRLRPFLTLEKFDPFAVRSFNVKVAISVRKRRDFLIDKYGALTLRMRELHRDIFSQ